MKNSILGLLLALPLSVLGVDKDYTWDVDTDATSYVLYTSIDEGTTWVEGPSSPTLPVTISLPETGTVFVRACSRNAQGELCRLEDFFGYNHTWKLPGVPINLSTP